VNIEVPSSWPGSDPEYYVNWALVKLNQEFYYQYSMWGGTTERGGAILDFYLPEIAIVINVQGTYWHSSAETEVKDALQKLRLESEGLILIYIDEEDARSNPVYYVKEAMQGISHARIR
jgi:adenosylcobinamide amidohydrolase